MASEHSHHQSHTSEVKSQFVTREGAYRLLPGAERSPAAAARHAPHTHPHPHPHPQHPRPHHAVRLSCVTLPEPEPPPRDRLAFNCGKELFVYVHDCEAEPDEPSEPLDRKTYKGTDPTCHDFDALGARPDSLRLLVGFSTGQIQVLDPLTKETPRLYNEERAVDKTRVTCVRWAPRPPGRFLASHASGHLYVYDEELGPGAAQPHYQLLRRGDGYTVHSCKTKSARNPLQRWTVGTGEGSRINEFAFSPDGAHLAVASQDGFLRVFRHETMELVGRARSYFGGFLCVAWSPDGEYVAVGGEDDLVTVWSFNERRVVARGQGHRSWVSVVAFDPYVRAADEGGRGACYRLGSVSQDTRLCLWDLTEEALRRPQRNRTSAVPCARTNGAPSGGTTRRQRRDAETNGGTVPDDAAETEQTPEAEPAPAPPPPIETGTLGAVTQRLAGLAFGDRRDRKRGDAAPEVKNGPTGETAASKTKNATVEAGNGPAGSGACGGCGARGACDSPKLIGTAACPRFEDCPVLEPLVCKKIAHERLTALLFRRDCLLTACQDGGVYTWARPGPSRATCAEPPEATRLFERVSWSEPADPAD